MRQPRLRERAIVADRCRLPHLLPWHRSHGGLPQDREAQRSGTFPSRRATRPYARRKHGGLRWSNSSAWTSPRSRRRPIGTCFSSSRRDRRQARPQAVPPASSCAHRRSTAAPSASACTAMRRCATAKRPSGCCCSTRGMKLGLQREGARGAGMDRGADADRRQPCQQGRVRRLKALLLRRGDRLSHPRRRRRSTPGTGSRSPRAANMTAPCSTEGEEGRRAGLAREARVEPVGLALERRPGEQVGGHLKADRALLARRPRARPAAGC